jgi:hypothetical protein
MKLSLVQRLIKAFAVKRGAVFRMHPFWLLKITSINLRSLQKFGMKDVIIFVVDLKVESRKMNSYSEKRRRIVV